MDGYTIGYDLNQQGNYYENLYKAIKESSDVLSFRHWSMAWLIKTLQGNYYENLYKAIKESSDGISCYRWSSAWLQRTLLSME